MNYRKNSNELLITSIAAILAIGLATPAFAEANDAGTAATPADVIPTTGAWTSVTFFSPGTDAAGMPFTFSCGATSCSVTITDGFLPIDWFDVFDFGSSIGTTPLPADSGPSCGGDPDACLAASNISHETFCVGPGGHSISFQDLDTGTGSVYPAGAFIKVVLNAEECTPVAGEYMSIDSTALLLAGASANAVWIIPVITGLAGAGVYLTRSKFNWI